MKRILVVVAGVLASFALLAVAAKTVTVVVGKTSIRKDRQPFARTLAEAVYRDKLLVIGKEERGWLKVSHKGAEGWVHKSAVSKKQVNVSARGARSGVSSDELVLAGKGFTREVEDEYKKKKPDLNFGAVDKVEKLTASESAQVAFVKDGKLKGREGAP